MLGHLKLHTVGDVDLSHSLGIGFGCAGYETDYDYNAIDGTTEGLKDRMTTREGGVNRSR
jgi:hypothetical protein